MQKLEIGKRYYIHGNGEIGIFRGMKDASACFEPTMDTTAYDLEDGLIVFTGYDVEAGFTEADGQPETRPLVPFLIAWGLTEKEAHKVVWEVVEMRFDYETDPLTGVLVNAYAHSGYLRLPEVFRQDIQFAIDQLQKALAAV